MERDFFVYCFLDLRRKNCAYVSLIDFVRDVRLDEDIDEDIDESQTSEEGDEKKEGDDSTERWVFT